MVREVRMAATVRHRVTRERFMRCNVARLRGESMQAFNPMLAPGAAEPTLDPCASSEDWPRGGC